MTSTTGRLRSFHNKNKIPTLKISLDEIIKDTFSEMKEKNIQSVIHSKIPRSNALMMEYIKCIYETYSIADPLGETLVKKNTKRKLSVSEEKIIRMKRDSRNYTPSTEKMNSKRELSSSASIKKRIMNPSTSHKNYQNQSPASQTSLKKSYKYTSQFQISPISISINPVFRYCIVCQQPILQFNIQLHQSNCPNFKSLYECSTSQIAFHLMSKITRLKSQISNLLSSQFIDQQHQLSIRSNTQQWLSNINENMAHLSFGLKFTRLYDNLIESINNKTFTLLDLTKKLRWFIQIRQKIKSKFNV